MNSVMSRATSLFWTDTRTICLLLALFPSTLFTLAQAMVRIYNHFQSGLVSVLDAVTVVRIFDSISRAAKINQTWGAMHQED